MSKYICGRSVKDGLEFLCCSEAYPDVEVRTDSDGMTVYGAPHRYQDEEHMRNLGWEWNGMGWRIERESGEVR